jgi:hypothetical protein
MKTMFITAVIAFAMAAALPTPAAAQPAHPMPPGKVCDPSKSGDPDHCRLEVSFTGGHWTTAAIVYFYQPMGIPIIWKIKQIPGGPQYGFKNDSLIVPANVTGFSNPCGTEDDDSCPGGNALHNKFRWMVDNPLDPAHPEGQTFDYELKLYPKNPVLSPIIVKVKAAAKPKDGRRKRGPVWVDPTIVIQG